MASLFPVWWFQHWPLRQVRELLRWQHLIGAFLAGMGAAVYLYLVWRQAGGAALQQQLREVTTRAVMRDMTAVLNTLLKPLIIFVLFLPGSALLLFYCSPARRTMPARARRLARVSWCFLLTGLVIWMITATYSSRYYLPLVTPVGILVGLAAEAVSPHAFCRDAVRRSYAVVPACQGHLRRVWNTFHPGAVIAFWGLMFWAVFSAFLQPAQAAARLELRAVATFSPQLAPESPLYIDTFVSGSSRRCGVRMVHDWNPHEPLPADVFLLVLQNTQYEELLARTDLKVEILERACINVNRTWLLARVSRDPRAR